MRPDVMDLLNLAPLHPTGQPLPTRSLLNATAPGSGVMMVVFGMVGNHTDWLDGELLVRGPDVNGWIDVVEYRSASTRWDFSNAGYEEWLTEILDKYYT